MQIRGLHIVICMLLFSSCGKKVDWTFSADKNSTQPFGLYLAYDRLNDIFPSATIETIYELGKELDNSSGSSYYKSKTVLVSVTANLHLKTEDALDLYNYVSEGGKVILLSQYFSPDIDSVFGIKTRPGIYKNMDIATDSINGYEIAWRDKKYQYNLDFPFMKSYCIHGDDWKAIGTRNVDSIKKSNLIRRSIGRGEIILGNAPEMIANYALLQDSNIAYYEKLFSQFPRSTKRVKWFSKYTVYPKRDKRNKSNFMKLLEQPSYRNAFFVLLLLASLFLIFETRRRQRIVDVVPPVKNDSLAFTELIGKLYYGEKDHLNLSQKMIRYYLEYVRTTYNIPTTHLNKNMAEKLARKLNKKSEETEAFINYLNTQLTAMQLSEADIKQLYITLKKYS